MDDDRGGGDGGAWPDTAWTLIVESEAFGARRVPFVRGRDARTEVRFAAPSAVEVTLVDHVPARDADRIAVRLVPVGGDSPAPPFLSGKSADYAVDERGRRTFSPVAPGTYVVSAWQRRDDSPHRGLRVAAERVTVGAGTARVGLRLPPFVDLAVSAPGLREKDRLELAPARSPGNYYYSSAVELDETLVATWKALPAGDYVLAGTVGGERREMRLEVSTAGTYTFVPGVLDGLAVTVDDPNGPLAAAGLQSGDVVVQIDGTEFETAWKARSLAAARRDEEGVEIVLLRGGGERALRVPGALLAGFHDVGGWWVPVRR